MCTTNLLIQATILNTLRKRKKKKPKSDVVWRWFLGETVVHGEENWFSSFSLPITPKYIIHVCVPKPIRIKQRNGFVIKWCWHIFFPFGSIPIIKKSKRWLAKSCRRQSLFTVIFYYNYSLPIKNVWGINQVPIKKLWSLYVLYFLCDWNRDLSVYSNLGSTCSHSLVGKQKEVIRYEDYITTKHLS
jgi:hypothetical protein